MLGYLLKKIEFYFFLTHPLQTFNVTNVTNLTPPSYPDLKSEMVLFINKPLFCNDKSQGINI